MFGYLVADRSNLSEEEFNEYRAAYCGICSVLRKNGLISGTLSLSYDLVFLWMLLSSMYEPDEYTDIVKCPVHPFSGTRITTNAFSGYVAGIGSILSYYKALDDWRDEGDILKLAASGTLKNSFSKAKKDYPRQSEAIKGSLDRISMLEKSQSGDVDALCNAFGSLLGEVFVYYPVDHWAEPLRALGNAVGRYLYLLDAVLDLKGDIKHKRYNPLYQSDKNTYEWQKNAVDLFLGDVSELYGFLPVVRYSSVLDSIIYSGMSGSFKRFCEENAKGE